ncbi:hypothetical protein [Sandaracinus amylolyticus]|uniref:hypothetical protein n=1 Tax=Sandaracinus amylolyticus TaxID=927083 RepID=UPI001F346EC2|nr:hypothetical protein [Sandaracinus amylolyticus]UJR81749.1 Hypothetical protein I5071_38090 [Sandaracinus amylolyticus]
MRTTAILTLLAMLAMGCERDNPTPPDAGGRRDAQVDSGELDGGQDPEPTDAQVDAQLPDRELPDGGECTSRPDCWSCLPTEPEHFLNGCTDSTCIEFPITQARLPRLRADGTVPPLP